MANSHKHPPKSFSRREFLNVLGIGSAGVFLSTPGFSALIRDFGKLKGYSNTQVAATVADNYERTFIRQKIEHIFEAIGGLSDIISPGDKVGIKINLTGGSSWANHANLNGVDVRECLWTHPEVLRAVGELLIDSGISGNNIYIVEAMWDTASFNNYGYQEVQQYLGAQIVNLNNSQPYANFITKATGGDPYFYDSFILNQVLDEVDAFVSIPKMKHHVNAGVTNSMKNLVGIVPLQYYQMPTQQGTRSKLHIEGGEVGYHLPRSICDLNMARPIHLAVIDGIKNAQGGEGPWNSTFEPCEKHLLLAGKDPVATDSIAAMVMGNDPESPTLDLPGGLICDNHLWLAQQKGLGTNILANIELVGDGAGGIHGIKENKDLNADMVLYQNFPNPASTSTSIKFELRRSGNVTLKIFSASGVELETPVRGLKSEGRHEVLVDVSGFAKGSYIFVLEMKGRGVSKKMVVK